MKTVAVWSGVAALAFVVVGMQIGSYYRRHDKSAETGASDAPATPVRKPAAVFPDDLTPTAQARGVPAAAAFQPSPTVHPMVFLRLDGKLHPWQERLREDWAADSVASTELAVIVGVPRKTMVSHHTFPNNAPPITRYLFELEISVIEAKTGKILANRLFRNVPRPLMHIEAWETTGIGRAVSHHQVFAWVSKMSKQGFPETHDPSPIVTQMD